MAEPKVLVVGCGAPQLGLVRAAKALGVRVVGADMNPDALAVADCAEFAKVSTRDPDAVAAAVAAHAATAVTSCGSEIAVATAATVADRLGLPFYASPATIERCQSKDLMRAAYHAGAAPAPAFAAVTSFAEVEAFVGAHGLPIVLKPARGWGQRGVSKATTAAELRASFDAAKAASTTGVAIAEAFIEGREYSVNAWTSEGSTEVLSVTERVITEYPDPPGITFAEWYPSGLSPEAEAAVVAAAVSGARALGITRGPSYTQMRHGPKGAFIVETAHRLGGGLDPDVALLASGISYFERLLGVALGLPAWERAGAKAPRHGGAIGHFLIGRPGRVVAIEGLDEARALPGVVGAEVWIPVGGVVHPLTDGSKRAGHVLAHGRDRDDARANALRAASAIRIVTES